VSTFCRLVAPALGTYSVLTIDLADTMPHGWQAWLDWQKAVAPDNEVEMKALEDDHGSYLGYIRVIGRRRREVTLGDHNRFHSRAVYEEDAASERAVILLAVATHLFWIL